MFYSPKVNIEDENSTYVKALKEIENDRIVLDVGCATGEVGELLKEIKQSTLIGIDCSREHIDEANKKGVYSDLYQIDLNKLNDELDKYKNKVDYILMLDVLEHLYFPADVIKKLKSLLSPTGKFIVSVPNISHASIKLNLLLNNFRYTSYGLLDSTHIHFFTLNSLFYMITAGGFLVESFERIYVESSTVDQPVKFNKIPSSVLNFIKKDHESFAYQYFVTFKPSDKSSEQLNKHNSSFKRVNKRLLKKYVRRPINAPRLSKILKNKVKKVFKKI